MLKAAVGAVNEHGKENVNSLLEVFEDFLMEAPDNASYDTVRQSGLSFHLNSKNISLIQR